MVDVVIKVLEPATSFALLTLEECKMMLGLPTAADPVNDPALQFMIDTNSAVIAAKCNNRVFAKEKVKEYWRCLQPARMFLSHWPVKESDIVSVETPDGTPLAAGDYQLEEGSGKILLFKSKAEPIVVTYTGGFALPDDAPDALKQATALMIGISRGEQQRAATSGIRMLAHKSARVQFQSDSGSSGGGGGGGNTATLNAIDALLSHFTRYWI